MNYVNIIEFIKENRIVELNKIEDDPTFFYEEAHRKALKLCINKLKNTWLEDDESYFKMICHHKEVESETFIGNLKAAKSQKNIARLWIEFVDQVNRTERSSFLKPNLD